MKKNLSIVVGFALGALVVAGSGILWAQEKQVAVAEKPEEFKALCSTNEDCKRPGMIGVCQTPGEKTARCLWQEVVKVPAIVIEPTECYSCQTSEVIEQLRTLFPGLTMEYLKASDPKAQKLIDQMKIKMLPAYIFSKEVEREPTFAEFKKMSTKIEDQYYAKPEFSGVSFFLGRASEKNKLDVFVVLTAPGMIPSVKIAKEIALNKKNGVNVSFHFLGIEDATTKKLISPGNVREASEEKACACVEKYYPKQSWDYLLERLTKADDIWVEDSLQALRMDVKKIKNCAKGPEGEKLLQEKVRLAKELDIRYAPLFLMGNVEIFGVNEKTTAQEVVQVIKGELKAQ